MTLENPLSTAATTSNSASSPLRHSRKAALMVGAASLALGAGLSPDEAKAQNKWEPWVAAGGLFGSDQQGELDIFIPLVQDANSMLFFNAQGLANTNEEQQGSLGLGYRTMVNANWILGINGFFDIKSTQYDNTFLQGGVGLEALSEDFDLRLNGHFPESDSERVPELGFRPFVFGNDFGILSYNERALAGVDGEVGYKLPFFNSDPDFEIRVFAGGFYYPNSNPGGQDIVGPKGRVEARLYDLDFLTNGSRLVLGGEVRDDDVRGTEGFGSVLIRMPLSIFSGGAPKLTGLDRRMVDRIERDMIITGIGYQTENVFINNGDAEVGSIFFAADGGTGDGTYFNQDSVADALAAGGGTNSLVVLDPSGGTYTTPGITLGDGQSLVGAGKAIKLTGAYTGQMTYFTPKPFYAGTTPTIFGANGANNLITIGNNSSVVNLNLEGAFNNGIFGAGLESNFWIQDNTIDLTFAFANGINVAVNNPVDNTNNAFGPTTPSGVVNWNVIGDQDLDDQNGIVVEVLGSGPGSRAFDLSVTENVVSDFTGMDNNGIVTDVRSEGIGSTLKSSVDVSDNTITNVSNYAISLSNEADDGAVLDQDDPVTVNGNLITDIGDVGIIFRNFANVDSEMAQTVTVNDNSLTRLGDIGIQLGNFAALGASLSQTIDIRRNDLSEIESTGIGMNNRASGGGVLDQANTTNITDNTITDTARQGIFLFSESSTGGTILQTKNVDDNTISETELDGIFAYNNIDDDGSFIGQTMSISGNRIDDAGDGTPEEGIFVRSLVDDLTTLTQTLNINENIIDDVTGDGIFNQTVAGTGSFVDQANTININNNTIANTGQGGILIETYVANDGTTAVQTLNVNGNTMSAIADKAIYIDIDVKYGGFLDQANTITIAYNTITGVDNEGIEINNFVKYGATYASTLLQTINIHHNSVSDVGDEGIEIDTEAYGPGVTVNQDIDIDDNSIEVTGNNGNDGIQIENDVGYGAIIDQEGTINIRRNTIVSASGDGILVENDISDDAGNGGSTLLQTLNIDDNVVGQAGVADAIDGHGIAVSSFVRDEGSLLRQEAGIDDNNVHYAGERGIYVYTDAQDRAVADQANTITIDGNTVLMSGGAGIEVVTEADSAGTVTQTLNVTDNSVSGSGASGIEVYNYVYGDDPATSIVQTIDISRNTVTGNTTNGIELGNLISYDTPALAEGTIIQTGDVDDNTITDNGTNGVLIDDDVFGGGVLVQTISMDPNTITGNTSDGVDIRVNGRDDSNVTVDLTLTDNTIAGNDLDGVYFDIDAGDNATVTFDLALDNNTITNNETGGVDSLFGAGGDALLNVDVRLTGNTITNNTRGNGIEIFGSSQGDSITNVYLGMSGGNVVDMNGADGLRVYLNAFSSAFVDGVHRITESSFSNNGTFGAGNYDGVSIRTSGSESAILHSDTHIIDVTAYGNEDDGIDLFNRAGGAVGADVDMDVHLSNTTVNANTGFGVEIVNGEFDSGAADQLVSFGPGGGNEVINNSGADDIYIYNNGGMTTVNLTGVNFGTYGANTVNGGVTNIIP